MAGSVRLRRLLQLCSIVILCGCHRSAETTTETVRAPSGNGPVPAAAKTQKEKPSHGTPTSMRGELLFNSYCAACHQRGGQGAEGQVPPLDNSPWVSGSEERLIRIVLNGLRGPIEIHGQVYNLEMPGFRLAFADADIASILAYIRRRYGAPSPPITTEKVARVRRETQERTSLWTVEELLLVP